MQRAYTWLIADVVENNELLVDFYTMNTENIF